MIVYVAQTSYPSGDLVGEVLCVGSEWNQVMKQVMEHHELSEYVAKRKVADNKWRIHVDGDLYVDVIKFTVDAPIPKDY